METMADSEFAWTSFNSNAKTFRHVRIRVKNASILLKNPLPYTVGSSKITQNQTTKYSTLMEAVCRPQSPCDMEGYSLDICEIDSRTISTLELNDLRTYKRQGVLFAPEQIKPEQTKLIL